MKKLHFWLIPLFALTACLPGTSNKVNEEEEEDLVETAKNRGKNTGDNCLANPEGPACIGLAKVGRFVGSNADLMFGCQPGDSLQGRNRYSFSVADPNQSSGIRLYKTGQLSMNDASGTYAQHYFLVPEMLILSKFCATGTTNCNSSSDILRSIKDCSTATTTQEKAACAKKRGVLVKNSNGEVIGMRGAFVAILNEIRFNVTAVKDGVEARTGEIRTIGYDLKFYHASREEVNAISLLTTSEQRVQKIQELMVSTTNEGQTSNLLKRGMVLRAYFNTNDRGSESFLQALANEHPLLRVGSSFTSGGTSGVIYWNSPRAHKLAASVNQNLVDEFGIPKTTYLRLGENTNTYQYRDSHCNYWQVSYQ